MPQFLPVWSWTKSHFLWTVNTSNLSWVVVVPVSNFLHAVNALACWVQHKLTLHWGYGLKLMQTCQISKRLFLLDWFLVKPYIHQANSGWQHKPMPQGMRKFAVTYTANQHMVCEKKSCGFTLQVSEATHTSACSPTRKIGGISHWHFFHSEWFYLRKNIHLYANSS